MTSKNCKISFSSLIATAAIFFLCLSAGMSLAAVLAPTNPINDRGEPWERKVLSTASGMIHIQWRYESQEPPDSYRIYRAEGSQNPFATESRVQAATPWQSDLPSLYCFFRYLPEDEDEGKRFWFLVRAVKNGIESNNLDAESVVVDLPWIDGRLDPNSINFYVEDDQRGDSFWQESEKCPFCSQTNKTYFRLARAYLAFRGTHAAYYVDRDFGPPPDLEAIVNSFENEIYPTNLAYFGRDESSEFSDVDSNGQIIILLTKLGGPVGGYFNAEDKILGYQYQNRVSNCADMLYVSVDSPLLSIKGTMAHELQHMQHLEANVRRGALWEELWLDETCSLLAEEVNNLFSINLYCYPMMPNEISLTRFGYSDVHDRFGGCPIHWTDSQKNYEALLRVIAHYEQAALFGHYMEYNCSPATALSSLVEDPNQGLISVQNHLGFDFRQAFIDWTIANYLNPYTDSRHIRYHYTAKFPSGASALETYSVKPQAVLSTGWIKSPDQEPAWIERSLRDLCADYVLFPSNGLPHDHLHWEIRKINPEENVCHLAIVDRSNQTKILLQDIADIPLFRPGDEALFGSGKFVLTEADGQDLESCLIVSNLSSYQDSNYISYYECRAYLTRSPSVFQVKLIQADNEWTLKGPAADKENHRGISSIENNQARESAPLIRAGWLRVIIQFDQSMDEQSALSPILYFSAADNSLPPGAGAAAFQPAAAQPAALNPWSKTVYPSDTWTGQLFIPQGQGGQLDGLARLCISGGKNFCHEPMEKEEQIALLIDTKEPLQPVISRITAYSASPAVIELDWSRSPEPDLAEYRLFGISPTPLVISLNDLSDPNHPSLRWIQSDAGIYTLSLTAVDRAGNESQASDPVSVGIGVEVPLSAGLNLVSYPIEPPFGYTSDLWLADLGLAAASLHRYQPKALAYETTYWSKEGKVQGSIFPILQDSGYLMYRYQAGRMTLSGPIHNRPLSLCRGRNMVGGLILSEPILSENESSYDFLRALLLRGDMVSSILVYCSDKGRWESSYNFFGQTSGGRIKIGIGQGCLVDLLWTEGSRCEEQ